MPTREDLGRYDPARKGVYPNNYWVGEITTPRGMYPRGRWRRGWEAQQISGKTGGEGAIGGAARNSSPYYQYPQYPYYYSSGRNIRANYLAPIMWRI